MFSKWTQPASSSPNKNNGDVITASKETDPDSSLLNKNNGQSKDNVSTSSVVEDDSSVHDHVEDKDELTHNEPSSEKNLLPGELPDSSSWGVVEDSHQPVWEENLMKENANSTSSNLIESPSSVRKIESCVVKQAWIDNNEKNKKDGDGGGVTSEGGGMTGEGGDVTSESGGVTSEGGGVTSEGGGVTSEGGGVTSEGGGVTSEGGSVPCDCRDLTIEDIEVTEAASNLKESAPTCTPSKKTETQDEEFSTPVAASAVSLNKIKYYNTDNDCFLLMRMSL